MTPLKTFNEYRLNSKDDFAIVLSAVALFITVVAVTFVLIGVHRNQKTNHQQQEAIVVLCDRGFILEDIVSTTLLAVNLRLTDDIRDKRRAAVVADRITLHNYAIYHDQLVDQLTGNASPCAN